MSSCSCGSGYDRDPDLCSAAARRELLVVRDEQAGGGARERCDGCAEFVGNYHLESCPVYAAAVVEAGAR